MLNCSQTKFVTIILVLLVFFNAIFRLTDFSSDPFDFLSSKTGSAQRALSALRASQLFFSSNCFGDLWCEGRFLEVENTPTVDPPLLHNPPRTVSTLLTPLLPIPSPVTPWLATDGQPLAKNTQLYTNFHNFFQAF